MKTLPSTPDVTIAQQIADLCQQNPFIFPRTPDYIEKTIDSWIVISNEIQKVQGCCENIIGNDTWTELGALMVDPDCKNQGFGQALWTQFNQEASTPHAYAVVHKNNIPALSFFKKRDVETTINYPDPIANTTRNMKDRVCFIWKTMLDHS